MSRRLLLLNAMLGALGLLFAHGLARELLSARALPPEPAPRAAPAATPPPAPTARQVAALQAWNVIPARNLFNPGRSETGAAPAAAAPVKVFLHGVVVDGERSRAYIEDPAAKRVFGYRVGDPVAGGRLERIGIDRVVIARPEGPLEVLLHDPAKPKPAPPAAAPPMPQRPAGAPGATPVPPPVAVPAQPAPQGGGPPGGRP